jgi:putative membrane protein
MAIPHRRFFHWIAAAWGLVWIALAIRPHDRADWALENALVLPFVALLFLTARRFPFSRVSYTLIFVFLLLHAVGAHYTYSLVPYRDWWRGLTGLAAAAERNHFDRFVHFAFGLLLAYPVREIFLRVTRARGFWGYYLPVDVTMAFSMVFELFEWAAAVFFGGDLGVAYLGTQGDPWDAHKDMLLATVGAVLSMILTALLNARLQRDFAREFSDSLRVKEPAPLGEDAIRKMLKERDRGGRT